MALRDAVANKVLVDDEDAPTQRADDLLRIVLHLLRRRHQVGRLWVGVCDVSSILKESRNKKNKSWNKKGGGR